MRKRVCWLALMVAALCTAFSLPAFALYDAKDYTASNFTKWAGNCKEFAREVMLSEGRFRLPATGSDGRTYPDADYLECSLIGSCLNSETDFCRLEDISSLFANAIPGDVVQMKWRNGYLTEHTAIVASFPSENTVTFLEANNPSGTIKNNNYTYEELAGYYNGAGKDGGVSIYRVMVPLNETNFPDDRFRARLDAIYGFDGKTSTDLRRVNPGESSLNIEVQSLEDLTGIKYFTALDYLHCRGNALTTLDVSSFSRLRYLDCEGNSLKMLDISGLMSLEFLRCSYNVLTSLDVSGCSGLKYLYCDVNNLTELSVDNCTALIALNCSNNALTSLDVSDCKALLNLYCSDNTLKELNVNSLTNLSELYCHGNKLTKLNLNGLTYLFYLTCATNTLTKLDVTSCTALEYLDCTQNALTELDVTSCATGINVFCDSGVKLRRTLQQAVGQGWNELMKNLASALGYTSEEAQQLSTDNATIGSDRKVSEVSAPSGQTAAAALPQVCVKASGVYVMGANIEKSIPTGSKLFWNPYRQATASVSVKLAAVEDKGVFLDDDGNIIEGVPENHHVNVAAYLEEGVNYAPVIAVTDEIVEDKNSDTPSGGDTPSGNDNPSGGDTPSDNDTPSGNDTPGGNTEGGNETGGTDKEPASNKGVSFTPGFDVANNAAARSAITAFFGDVEMAALTTDSADIGAERTSADLTAEQLATVSSDTSAIAAILPEITAHKTAVYVIGATCDEKLEGALTWHSFLKTTGGVAALAAGGECLFLNDSGERITAIPSNGHVNAAVLLTADKTVAPVIAVTEDSGGSGSPTSNKGSGGCDTLPGGLLAMAALVGLAARKWTR